MRRLLPMFPANSQRIFLKPYSWFFEPPLPAVPGSVEGNKMQNIACRISDDERPIGIQSFGVGAVGEDVLFGFGRYRGGWEGEVAAGDAEEPLIGILDHSIDRLPRNFGFAVVGFDSDACFGEGERRGFIVHLAIDI